MTPQEIIQQLKQKYFPIITHKAGATFGVGKNNSIFIYYWGISKKDLIKLNIPHQFLGYNVNVRKIGKIIPA